MIRNSDPDVCSHINAEAHDRDVRINKDRTLCPLLWTETVSDHDII
jgi:hypothetical protein